MRSELRNGDRDYLARAFVQGLGYAFEIDEGVAGEVGAFGEVLAQ